MGDFFSPMLKSFAKVYMATTKYASEYLMQYKGHNTPVNNVKFNPFVPVSLNDKTSFIFNKPLLHKTVLCNKAAIAQNGYIFQFP